MKNRFDLLIFDWDGTLANSIDWIIECIQYAAQTHSCPAPDAESIRQIIGLSIEQAMHTLFPELDQGLHAKMAIAYASHFGSKTLAADHLFPGVPELLSQLKDQGFMLAVATSKKRQGLDKLLISTETGPFFSSTRCANQTASKPDPLMILEIMEELGTSRERTLMIGDSVHDMQMAINAGIDSVAVTCGTHSEATLKAYQPLMCLPFPTDLIDLL